ncbi:MAG: CHASE3 domain-containing protein [Flavobacteriales bacterium]|nr:CHASE3 domain-containing protein [Flavobacteriales bacterium]
MSPAPGMPYRPNTTRASELRLMGLLYVGTLLLLFGVLYFTYKSFGKYREAQQQVRHLNRELLLMETSLSALKDAETGCRGYLLTHDTTFLAPYGPAADSLTACIAELERINTDPGMEPRLQAFSLLSNAMLDHLSGLAVIGPADSSARTQRVRVELMESKMKMDVLRDHHQRMVGDLRLARAGFLEEERAFGWSTPFMLLLYAVMAIMATALLFWRLFRTLKQAQLAEAEIKQKAVLLDTEVHSREFAERSLRRVLDTSPIGIMSFRAVRGPMGTIDDLEWLFTNDAGEGLLDRKAEELVGKRLLVEMPGNRSAGLFDAYVQVVESGQAFRAEQHYTGEGLDLWLSIHAVRLLDGVLVMFMDISAQKRAHAIAIESSRLELTDRIARTVAHEVRNPLTNLHLALEQLNDELPAAQREEAEPYISILERNIQRIGQLISEMLESAKRRELDLAPCHVADLMNKVMRRVADRLALQNMKGEVSVETDLPDVRVDHDLVELAFTNLAVNAIEAMEPHRGRLFLKAYRDGADVIIEIMDNGRGVPPEELARLFEPYYSGRAGGLGLGLTTSRTILNSHGVSVDVKSEVGKGTTFILRFPTNVMDQVERVA